MNLVLDIGNTNVKMALFDSNQMMDYQLIKNFAFEKIQDFIKKNHQIKNIYYSDTKSFIKNPDTYFKDFKMNVVKVDYKLKLPISIEYGTPETLGSDRIALAVGAGIQYDGMKLIIDTGTCITYDIVSEKKYIGGQISPGINMRLSALNHYTSNLPKINFDFPKDFIANTTKSAILKGVYDGIVFEINGIIQNYKLRYPNIVVILTGGDLKKIETEIKNVNFINRYLLMEGLNYIIASNE